MERSKQQRLPGLIKIGEIWHIDKRGKYFPGGRLRESTGCRDLEEATAYALKRFEEFRQAAVFGVRPRKTFKEAATKYLEENLHKRSIADDALHLKQLAPFIGQLPLEAVCDDTLKPFIAHRKAQGIRQKSINNALGVVRRILNLAARNWRDHGKSWLETAPLITLPTPNDARKPYPLSWREQDCFFPRLPTHLARMALFKVNTGTREQEVCQLRWEWEQRVVELDTSVFVVPKGIVKNGEERLIVLNDVAKSIIESVRGEHPDFVFVTRPTKNGKRKPRPIANMNNSTWQRRRIDTALDMIMEDSRNAGFDETISSHKGNILVTINARRTDKARTYRLRYTTDDYDRERQRRGLPALSKSGRRDPDLRQSLRYKARERLFAEFWPEYEGLSNVRVHDLKHTFGRRLRAAGVPTETRKVLLGHANRDITTHYCAAEIEELIEAANRVSARKMPELTLLKSARG